MLIVPKAYGIYAYALHSPREEEEIKNRLKKSNKKITDATIALELAKKVWCPDKNGAIWRARLKETGDVKYITTKQLNQERATYQRTKNFQYSVGEQIGISVERYKELLDQLKTEGVSQDSVNRLECIFNDESSLKNGVISFHVIHVANSRRSEPYQRYDDEVERFCHVVVDHKPYYELTPTHYTRHGWSQIMFAPKDLIEKVAVLFPEPYCLKIFSHLCAPDRIQT